MSTPNRPALPPSTEPLYWCGPYAIAVLASVDYKTALRAARRAEQERLDALARERGYAPGIWKVPREVGGLPLESTKMALAKAFNISIEWNMVEQPKEYYDRNHKFIPRIHVDDIIEKFTDDGVYLVCSREHYMVVHKGMIYHACDTEPVHFRTITEVRGRALAWARVNYPLAPAN